MITLQRLNSFTRLSPSRPWLVPTLTTTPRLFSYASTTKTTTAPRERITLTGAEATALPMLYFRAIDASHTNPILNDPHAQSILDHIDITAQLGTSVQPDQRHIDYFVGRAKRFDQWCQTFIDSHNKTNTPITVVHLACGLDTRALRVKRGPNVRWIDIDQPPITALRARLLDDTPIPGDYSLRATPLSDLTSTIPADRPTLVLAEGLVMYLTPAQGAQLIRDCVGHFAAAREGRNELMFDTIGSLCVRLSSRWARFLKPSGAVFYWGVDDVEAEIASLDARLRAVESVYWWQWCKRQPPVFGEWMTRLMSLHPKSRTSAGLHRLEF